MKLIKQTVYLEEKSKKADYFCETNGGYFGVKECEGYFFTEQELKELLENTWSDGNGYYRNPSYMKEEYINNLLKEE